MQKVVCTSDASVAFKDVDIVIMLGAFPRGPGMERADLLAKNCNIFKQQVPRNPSTRSGWFFSCNCLFSSSHTHHAPRPQGRLLNEIASRDVKVRAVPPVHRRAASRSDSDAPGPSSQVVVVGNPANTNAWVCAECAPAIPKSNFTALTRLDANRAQSQVCTPGHGRWTPAVNARSPFRRLRCSCDSTEFCRSAAKDRAP